MYSYGGSLPSEMQLLSISLRLGPTPTPNWQLELKRGNL